MPGWQHVHEAEVACTRHEAYVDRPGRALQSEGLRDRRDSVLFSRVDQRRDSHRLEGAGGGEPSGCGREQDQSGDARLAGNLDRFALASPGRRSGQAQGRPPADRVADHGDGHVRRSSFLQCLDQSGGTGQKLRCGRCLGDYSLEVRCDHLAVVGRQVLQEGAVTLRVAACSGSEQHDWSGPGGAERQDLHVLLQANRHDMASKASGPKTRRCRRGLRSRVRPGVWCWAITGTGRRMHCEHCVLSGSIVGPGPNILSQIPK